MGIPTAIEKSLRAREMLAVVRQPFRFTSQGAANVVFAYRSEGAGGLGRIHPHIHNCPGFSWTVAIRLRARSS